MEELNELINKLGTKNPVVIHNLKVILQKKSDLLTEVQLNSRNFKLIFLGSLQERAKEFRRSVYEANEEIKAAYEAGKSQRQHYPNVMLESFIAYWAEPDQNLKKMRFEDQKYWSLKGRLATWYRKSIYSK